MRKSLKLDKIFIDFKKTVIDSGRTLVAIYSLAKDVTMDTSTVQKMSGRKRKL